MNRASFYSFLRVTRQRTSFCFFEKSATFFGIEKTFEELDAFFRMKLFHRFGFDLTDAFARDIHDAPDFFEGVFITVLETESQLDDLPFARGERL